MKPYNPQLPPGLFSRTRRPSLRDVSTGIVPHMAKVIIMKFREMLAMTVLFEPRPVRLATAVLYVFLQTCRSRLFCDGDQTGSAFFFLANCDA